MSTVPLSLVLVLLAAPALATSEKADGPFYLLAWVKVRRW